MTAQFITSLDVRQLDETRWELLAPLIYVGQHRVEVVAGFITDFASVPRLPFVYLLVGGIGNAAAVIHDFIYQTHKISREQADALFCEALNVLGEPWWRSKLMYHAVRIFGRSAYTTGPARFQVLNVERRCP